MKLIYSFIVLIVMLFTTGCSNKVSNMTEKYNSLKMKIDNKKSEKYYLIDKYGEKILSGYSKNGILNFKLPTYLAVNQCLHIKNHKNKDIKLNDSSNKGFKLTLVGQYEKLSSKIDNINQKINSIKTAIENHKKNHLQDKNKLSYNRAYNDGTCSVPSMKSIPSKPSNVICTSKNECRSEGALLCIKVLLGSEACGRAAKENGYSSFESSALCSFGASSSLSQKYGVDDAINDSLWGSIEDYADDKLDNGGFFGKAFGGFLKLTTFANKKQQVEKCQTKFMQKYYNAYVDWSNDVYNIEREPQKLYNSCKSTVVRMEENKQSYFKEKEKLLLLRTKKVNLLEELEDIKEQEIAVNASCK